MSVDPRKRVVYPYRVNAARLHSCIFMMIKEGLPFDELLALYVKELKAAVDAIRDAAKAAE